MNLDLEQSLKLSKPALLKRTLLALVAAGLIVVGIVLPAEYGLDPTGFGRLTGLLALAPQSSAPTETAVTGTSASMHHKADLPFRSDTIEIPLAAEGEDGYELEYKVHMQAGSTLVYSWSTTSNVYYDFHSESDAKTAAKPGDKPKSTVMSHRIEDDAMQSHGSLTAPFDGIHGWYWQNHDIKPIKITLKLSGFYEMHEMKP